MPILNHGGTCYAAAVVHALASIESFSSCLQHEAGDAGPLVAGHPAADLQAALAAVVAQVRAQLSHFSGPHEPALAGPPVSIRQLLSLFRLQHPDFLPFEQNDAQEFLVLLIDALAGKAPVFEGRGDSRPPVSYLVQSLHGQTCHDVTCPACGARTRTRETFSTLQVYVDDGGDDEGGSSAGHLGGAIKRTLRSTPTMPGFLCDSCGARSEGVTRAGSAWRLPMVLAVVLVSSPRVHKSAQQGGMRAPMQLALDSTIAGDSPFRQQPYRYQLRSMVNHYGSMLGGHYTSVAHLGPVDGAAQWAVLDDDRVHLERLPPAMECLPCPSSYMLFYERIPSPPPLLMTSG